MQIGQFYAMVTRLPMDVFVAMPVLHVVPHRVHLAYRALIALAV